MHPHYPSCDSLPAAWECGVPTSWGRSRDLGQGEKVCWKVLVEAIEKRSCILLREYLISMENGWGDDTLCLAVLVQVYW